jgi:hypothetical protein
MLHCVVFFILFSAASFVGFVERNKTQLAAAVGGGGVKILFITFLMKNGRKVLAPSLGRLVG